MLKSMPCKAFDVETGRPVSMLRVDQDMNFYVFARTYADMKWPDAAATTRRTNAEALTKATIAMISSAKGRPDDKLLRRALNRWGFNLNCRNSSDCPTEIRRVLDWLERNTRNVSSLVDPAILRPVLSAIAVRVDGKPGAPSVVNRHRKSSQRPFGMPLNGNCCPKTESGRSSGLRLG